jgi:histidinol-phosphate aminotransferase
MQSSKYFLKQPVHGSITPDELRKLGLKPEEVLDFSANINPLGISAIVREAIARVDIARYPDPDCLELREALASNLGVGASNIIIGNGATEIIHLLARALLGNGGVATVLAPTFGEYESACRMVGIESVMMQAREDRGFLWDIDDTCHRIEELKPQLVFLCNPNNPTGLYLDSKAVEHIAKASAPGMLVIDEAYVPFVGDSWDSTVLLDAGNIVLLRSMTKDHALAGLRLGYAILSAEATDAIRLRQPFWSVNAMAQAAGLAAIAVPQHVAKAKEIVNESKAYLHGALEEIGLKVLPSSANFLLVKVGDAGAIRSALLRSGLCVRDCTSFSLPQYIRVAVRTLPDCLKLVKGLREILNV